MKDFHHAIQPVVLELDQHELAGDQDRGDLARRMVDYYIKIREKY